MENKITIGSLRKEESLYLKDEVDNIISNDLDLSVEEYEKEHPPKYREVCPPTFKESFYYPNVIINLMPDHNCDLTEYKKNEKKVFK